MDWLTEHVFLHWTLLPVQIDAHYDEQKELIQQQLVMEQQLISDVDRAYSVSRSGHLPS